MKCNRCHQNEANVYIEQVAGHERKEMHLCNECAISFGMGSGMSLGIPFMHTNTFQLDQAFKHAHNFWFSPESVRKESLVCAACGYSFERFKKSSLLGCADCYEAFRSELLGIFAKVQSSAKHIGKVPGAINEAHKKDNELSELKAALRAAIDAEEYEEAAKIRDKVRELEGGK